MMRAMDLMTEFGYGTGDSGLAIDNPCSQMLASLLGLPAPSER